METLKAFRCGNEVKIFRGKARKGQRLHTSHGLGRGGKMTPWQELMEGKTPSYTPAQIKTMTLGAFGLANCLQLKGKKKYVAAAGKSAEELRAILHENPNTTELRERGRYRTYSSAYATKIGRTTQRLAAKSRLG